MKHTQKHFTIKNVVLLSSANAQKPCNKNEDFKLYKLWMAAKRDILREVLDDAFRPQDTENKDTFEFCDIKDAPRKVQHALRTYGYANPEEYVTFEITSWNSPFECSQVQDFDELIMQEFTLTCDITYRDIAVRDTDGRLKYNENGKVLQRDGGGFSGTTTFVISDLDIDETFDE